MIFKIDFKQLAILLFFFFLTLWMGIDIVYDISHSAFNLHAITEILLTVISASAMIWTSVVFIKTTQKLNTSQVALRQANYRLGELTSAFWDTIESQFTEWKLSDAEKEIARFLLQGLTFKEIALQRYTQEKTVRAHATALYSKSGFANRNEFSSYFLSKMLQGPRP